MADSASNPVRATNTHPPRRKPHHYASNLLAGLGIVANITAIVGLLTSHVSFIISCAAVLAIIAGLYLLLKRWGKPIGWSTLFAVVIIIAGSITLVLALQSQHVIHKETQKKKENISTDVAKDDDKGTYYVLRATEGIDLDDGKSTVFEQQSGAKAPADLYLSDVPYLIATQNKFYEYQPPRESSGNADTDEREACRTLISTSELGIGSISSFSTASGKRYCVATNRGAIMLLTMDELIDKGFNSKESQISFYVKVWQ
jgi:hypothetical protein